MKKNLINCNQCHCSMMFEEREKHVCFSGKIEEYYFDTEYPDKVIVYDGKNSFLMPISFLRIIWKFQQPKGNSTKTTDNETEPNLESF